MKANKQTTEKLLEDVDWLRRVDEQEENYDLEIMATTYAIERAQMDDGDY